MISVRPPLSRDLPAAAPPDGAPRAEQPPEILVVYYSRSGATAAVAKRIAERLRADVLALEQGTPVRAGGSPGAPRLLRRTRALIRAARGGGAGAPASIERRYRFVLALAPIWLLRPAPPLLERLREVDWGGAALFGVFTYATLYAPFTARALAEQVEARGARYLGHAAVRLHGADDPTLRAQVDALLDAHLPAWREQAKLGAGDAPQPAPALRSAPAPVPARAGGSILVGLKPRGSRPPLFCVTSGYGDVLALAGLAQRMAPERPFYALQPPLDMPPEPLATPEAIARRRVELCRAYAAAIRSVAPHGPYDLAGYSAGGLMAAAVAAHLRGAGEEVRHLLVLDPAGSVPEWEYRLFVRLKALVNEHVPRLDPARSRVLHVYHAYFTDDGFMTHVGAVTGYTPHRCAERVTLVSAEGSLMRFTLRLRRWRAAIGAALTIRRVPGDHLTFLRAPHVERLAECLRDVLGDHPEEIAPVATMESNP